MEGWLSFAHAAEEVRVESALTRATLAGSRPAAGFFQGTCWLRVVDTPEKLRPAVGAISRPGNGSLPQASPGLPRDSAEAVRATQALIAGDHTGNRHAPITSRDDWQMFREAAESATDAGWLDDSLWAGLVPFYGPVWTSLVGTANVLAGAFVNHKEIGVSQFIISGGLPSEIPLDPAWGVIGPLFVRDAIQRFGLERYLQPWHIFCPAPPG